MKTIRPLPRLLEPFSKPHPHHKSPIRHSQRPSHRPFVSSSTLTPLQTLTASRILPYPRSALYNLIADIPSYPSFLPYCRSSQITSRSRPDPTHSQTWPHTADLRIGWGPYDETFKSRIYCVPYHTLEACAGSASPTISESELPHYDIRANNKDSEKHDLFTSLLTRWTLSEFPFKPSPPDGPPQEGNAEARSSHPRTE
ncbi:MAG: hypothetical protein Q9222_006021, partial [Ikaeria aurantiellina]